MPHRSRVAAPRIGEHAASAPQPPIPNPQPPTPDPQPLPPARPDWSFEQAALAAGYRRIAGGDEVGRGAWAGPLVAAAVVFPAALTAAAAPDAGPCAPDGEWQVCLSELSGVRDSKQLSHAARCVLDACIRRHGEVGLGIVSAPLCDRIGMAAANRLALTRAIRALPAPPDYVLLDAFPLPRLAIPQCPLIKGDCRVVSIAAASIVAKVARDALMDACHACWPAYDFGSNKGYGTAAHQAALRSHGPTAEHRRSFDPLRTWLADEQS